MSPFLLGFSNDREIERKTPPKARIRTAGIPSAKKKKKVQLVFKRQINKIYSLLPKDLYHFKLVPTRNARLKPHYNYITGNSLVLVSIDVFNLKFGRLQWG